MVEEVGISLGTRPSRSPLMRAGRPRSQDEGPVRTTSSRRKRLNRLEVRKGLIVRADRQNTHVRRTGLQVCVNTVADFRFAPHATMSSTNRIATPILKLGIPISERF